MATVNPASPVRRRRGLRMLAVLGLLVAALLAWFWKPLNGYAVTGAAVGARVACSCHYLGGRSLKDCAKDFEPGMELITLSADEEAKSVTARFPLLAAQTATYRAGEGCRLEAWHD